MIRWRQRWRASWASSSMGGTKKEGLCCVWRCVGCVVRDYVHVGCPATQVEEEEPASEPFAHPAISVSCPIIQW